MNGSHDAQGLVVYKQHDKLIQNYMARRQKITANSEVDNIMALKVHTKMLQLRRNLRSMQLTCKNRTE